MSDTCSLYTLALTAALGLAVSVPAAAAPSDAVGSLSVRELKNLRQDVDRHLREEKLRALESERQEKPELRAREAERTPSGLRFTVKALSHNPSLVLTDEELAGATAPWVGREIETGEIADILNAVNRLYAQKGYLVCQAVVEPQRIRDGKLRITLVEGITERVTVAGAESTREGWIKSALSIEEGKIANYRDMIDRLVRFNMTNDVMMKVDIAPGAQPRSTAYRLDVKEPPRWTGGFFADSLGSESSGRGRAGASIVNHSLFGIRDRLSLLGMTSEGNKSLMLGYSVPLTTFGTRLSFNYSAGRVEVVGGPSDGLDIEGDSSMSSVRLEHPFYVTPETRWTGWIEGAYQGSKTDWLTLVLSDTVVRSYTAGVDGIRLWDKGAFTFGMSLSQRHAELKTADSGKRVATVMNGNASWRRYFENGASFVLNGLWQIKLGGDTIPADFFYLGNSSGVRGYDNDLLFAPSGVTASAQFFYPLPEGGPTAFLFADAGRVCGGDPNMTTESRSLYSAGGGLMLSLPQGFDAQLTLAVPLTHDRDEDEHIDKVRADLTLSYSW